jgi:hypothetical protein
LRTNSLKSMKTYIKAMILILSLCSLETSWGMSGRAYGGRYHDALIWRPPPIIMPGSSGVVPPGGHPTPHSSATSIYAYYDPDGTRLYYYFENGQIIYYTYLNKEKIYFYYSPAGDKVFYYR